jgi:transposase
VRLEVELTDAQLKAIAQKVAEINGDREERWLSQKELAQHFGCSVRTVFTWQKQGMPHIMVGSHPRYRASEGEAWLARQSGGRVEPIATGRRHDR